MAKIIPSIEHAKKAKQSPTDGEIFLLEYLEEKFDPDAEVYFQPCFNGDRPDIVIIKEHVGLIIIEVKDWNLRNYEINSNNHWVSEKKRNSTQIAVRPSFLLQKKSVRNTH